MKWLFPALVLPFTPFAPISLFAPLPACASTNAYQAAADYLESKNGHALLVYEDGELVFERYFNGWSADRPHRLASGTKSFAGAMLAAAVDDKLVQLDEVLAETITEWKEDPQRARITVRQLLSLTSGIDGGKIGTIPSYAEAVRRNEVRAAPGKRFSYGPVPFQIFGEFMHRKLQAADPPETVEQYLSRRVLRPIDCKPRLWRTDVAGQPRLPSGCAITAREWAKFGLLMLKQGRHGDTQIIREAALQPCFTGSKTSPRYGLGFWLNTDRALPDDLVSAAGMGKQKLFLIPSKHLLIVQFAEAKGYDESRFLHTILGQAPPAADGALRSRLLQSRFDRLDKDGDGKVTREEAPQALRLIQLDKNKDGGVDIHEFRAFLPTR